MQTIEAQEYCLRVTDGTHDSPKESGDGFFLITSRHLRRFSLDYENAYRISKSDYDKINERSKVEQWDILFSMIGTIGNLYIETNPNVNYACKNVGIFKMGGNKQKALWLFYYLQSSEGKAYIKAHLRGTTQMYVPLDSLRQLPIPVYDEKRTATICKILYGLDQKIELNSKINGCLEAQADALFQSLLSNPEGDCFEVSLADLMDYSGGSQPPASEFVSDPKPGYVRFVQIRDYESDDHITYIPDSSRNKLCDETDIMIARYGASLGRICFGLNGAYNVALAKVFPKKKWLKEYLRCYLSSRVFYEGINGRGGRSAQAGFNASDIASFKLRIPKDAFVLQEFEKQASLLFQTRLSNKKENKRLTVLRDSLLPKLMSGEIDVDSIRLDQ